MTENSPRNTVIGITGSSGSGKTTASGILRSFGATVISADELARQAVAPGSPCLKKIIDVFGPNLIDNSGNLDRKTLGTIVFNDPVAREKLEAIVHPIVQQSAREKIALHKSLTPIVVYDCPLLFETGLEKSDLLDCTLLILANEQNKIARLIKRDQTTKASVEKRLACQMSDDEKALLADYIITNDGTIEELTVKLRELWTTLSRKLNDSPSNTHK
ncbi:MAG: dephospho-CoA kinase [bacterium]|nr:dephospho-CoA kinase [bacterium]